MTKPACLVSKWTEASRNMSVVINTCKGPFKFYKFTGSDQKNKTNLTQQWRRTNQKMKIFNDVFFYWVAKFSFNYNYDNILLIQLTVFCNLCRGLGWAWQYDRVLPQICETMCFDDLVLSRKAVTWGGVLPCPDVHRHCHQDVQQEPG